MKDKLLNIAKALYAIPTVYRFLWTAVTVGAAAAAGYAFDNPTYAIAVGILTQAATSVAREHLAAKRA